MSNGQIFGSVLGAAIGFFFAPAIIGTGLVATAAGATSLGFTIGGLIGGLLDPLENTVTQTGPRLGDLSTQTAEWGTPIPRLFGSYKLTGNVIWSMDLHETKHVEESGEGKGGGGTKTETIWYSYAGSFAVSFSEGEIAGIKKIWFDSVLVYDGTHYSGGLSNGNHTVYLGNSSQPIDWYMDNGNTPAYRHVSYIIFRKIELENYGNRIPKVSVEAYSDGDLNDFQEVWTQNIPNLAPAIDQVSTYTQVLNLLPQNGYTNIYNKHHDNNSFDDYNLVPFSTIVYDGNTDVDVEFFSHNYLQVDNTKDKYYYLGTANESFINYIYINGAKVLSGARSELGTDPGNPFYTVYRNDMAYGFYHNGEPNITTNTIVKYSEKLSPSNSPYGSMGIVISGNEYMHIAVGSNELYTFNMTNDTIDVFNLNGVYLRAMDHSDFTFTFTIGTPQSDTYLKTYNDGEVFVFKWEDSNRPRIYRITDTTQEYIGKLGSKGSDYPGWINTFEYKDNFFYVWDPDTSGHEDYSIYRIFGKSHNDTKVDIGYIVRELLLRAGVEDSSIDVGDSQDLVTGYVVTKPMSTRAALTTLISAYNYELVETDFKIVLKKRDPTNIQTTISDFIEFTKLYRLQTVELSRCINIMYANKNKNYDAGIQTSVRNDHNTENTNTYQYPLALSDTEAKQISEIYLYNEWNGRLKFEFTITIDYIWLIPSDIIKIIYLDDTYIVRLTKLTYSTNKQIDCEAILEDPTIQLSDSIGSDTGSAKDEVSIIGPTNMLLLDIPMLDNSYNSEGIYIAANCYFSDWKGCTIDKSTDTKVTYSTIGQLTAGSIIGIVKDILQDGTTYVLDIDNQVTIDITIGEIYQIDYITLLNAYNYILIGDEILQYQNYIINGDGSYTLYNLLRGRRGTEWATNTHTINDRFVFLDTSMLFDVTASLNADSYYRPTTFGTYIEDSENYYISPEIRCLKPLSPRYIRGYRNISGDLIITWMRRSRDVTGYMKTLALFEETEEYEIVIGDDVRLLTSTSETVTYTASDQSDDSLLGLPVELTIYQLSGTVIRGYGTGAIL